MPREIKWMEVPEDHDYDAAIDFLSIMVDTLSLSDVSQTLNWLRDNQASPVGIEKKKAKDILRASGVELLPTDNPHVKKDLAKVNSGRELSPIILVRKSRISRNVYDIGVIIADGYHRVCAAWWTDENAEIPCLLV